MALSNPNHGSDSPRETKLSGYSTDGVDLITSLPDEILHHILSYIPTKYAVRTSVLSKRWKPVWHEIPSISIDCDEEDHVDSINKTLSSYSTLKFNSFNVRISYEVSISEQDPFYRWIELAMSRSTENFSLKLECNHSFPDFFYRNSSIKQLSLSFKVGLYADLEPKCSVSWTSLRSLSFDNIKIRDESIANIISGCPMLETLILSQCDEIHHLDLSRSLNLTRLEITGGHHHTIEPDEIVAPHIHYLSLTNVPMPPTLVDVSSLTEANFNPNYSLCGVKDDFLEDMVLKFLAKLQNVEKLTIGRLALQILSFAEIRDVPFPQLKIKSLNIETMPVLSVIHGIVRLLQTSPGLKKITIHTKKGNIITDKDLERYINGRWSGFFPATKQTSSSSFNSIAEEEKLEHVASFMEHVLWNTETLETMVLLRLGGYLNATEYQTLLSKVPCNKNFKIIP